MAPDNRTLASFLSDLRSGQPTPGGGSASAYCGSLGAALGAMVCRLTLGRASADESANLTKMAESLDQIVDLFSQAARDDELCFARYQAATRLPKGTDEERRIRRKARQGALRLAAEAPLATAELAVRALTSLPEIAMTGTHHALSDVETAQVLLLAALDGALISVQVNVDLIEDASIVKAIVERMTAARSVGREASSQVKVELDARGA